MIREGDVASFPDQSWSVVMRCRTWAAWPVPTISASGGASFLSARR
ncbi:MAG TPA: hypothetical protein VER83_03560 [Candidatus Nanopelagicales bacterium]|nr:hypothetical protein [Candidatus Nanopelagicales bacterium]